MPNSQDYEKRKAYFDRMITLYGRHAVDEVLSDREVSVHALHLAETNRHEGVIRRIEEKAKARAIPIKMHSRAALSRISKNGKQDQGVAIDIEAQNYQNADQIIALNNQKVRLLALDGIHNPQNLGMIIRSAAAGMIDGIILPKQGSAKLSPLVMKSSAGTLFKIPIYYSDRLIDVLPNLAVAGWEIYGLSSHAKMTVQTMKLANRSIFVLGNESEGVSEEIATLCTQNVKIPMQRGVESLNVAVTAALIAFMPS